MRSAETVRAHLDALRALDDQRQVAYGRDLTPDDGWDFYAAEDDARELDEVEREAAAAGGDLNWSINGVGVLDDNGGIYMAHLNAYMVPLRGALRWAARDIVAEEGMPATSADTWELVEPVFAGSYPGSFGLKINRGPVDEQLSLLADSLFDRTVSRLISVFLALQQSPDRAVVVAALAGFRKYTLSSLKALASAVIESGEASQVRWRDGPLVTIEPSSAAEFVAILETVELADDTVTVLGRLAGVDVDDQSFHIDGDPPESGGRRPNYRGAMAAMVRDLAAGLVDRRVRAVMAVTYADSPFRSAPKETYELRSIEPTDQV